MTRPGPGKYSPFHKGLPRSRSAEAIGYWNPLTYSSLAAVKHRVAVGGTLQLDFRRTLFTMLRGSKNTGGRP